MCLWCLRSHEVHQSRRFQCSTCACQIAHHFSWASAEYGVNTCFSLSTSSAGPEACSCTALRYVSTWQSDPVLLLMVCPSSLEPDQQITRARSMFKCHILLPVISRSYLAKDEWPDVQAAICSGLPSTSSHAIRLMQRMEFGVHEVHTQAHALHAVLQEQYLGTSSGPCA